MGTEVSLTQDLLLGLSSDFGSYDGDHDDGLGQSERCDVQSPSLSLSAVKSATHDPAAWITRESAALPARTGGAGRIPSQDELELNEEYMDSDAFELALCDALESTTTSSLAAPPADDLSLANSKHRLQWERSRSFGPRCEVEESDKENGDNSLAQRAESPPKEPEFVGFLTASNRHVELSEEAKKRGMAILEGLQTEAFDLAQLAPLKRKRSSANGDSAQGISNLIFSDAPGSSKRPYNPRGQKRSGFNTPTHPSSPGKAQGFLANEKRSLADPTSLIRTPVTTSQRTTAHPGSRPLHYLHPTKKYDLSTAVTPAARLPFKAPYQTPPTVKSSPATRPTSPRKVDKSSDTTRTPSELSIEPKTWTNYQGLPAARSTKDRLDSKSTLEPEVLSYSSLLSLNVSDEICSLDLDTAYWHSFMSPCGTVRDALSAIRDLKETNRTLASNSWVKQQWAQVLWSLASKIRANPDLSSRWTYDVVFSRLCRKYDKEFRDGLRPVLRKVFEHDIPASKPMILCVACIREKQDVGQDGSQQIVVLTDGWYKIQCVIDEPLQRAIAKGRLKVGSKLAIQSAHLESAEAGEPIASFRSTTLTIQGNSCSLALWSARLGAAREPFICTLSSLTSDGGMVPNLDLLVVRVFGLGFFEKMADGSAVTRNANEEAQVDREHSMKRDRIKERLAESIQEKIGSIRMLLDDLQALCSIDGTSSSHSQSSSEAFDAEAFVAEHLESSERSHGANVKSLTVSQQKEVLGYIKSHMDKIRATLETDVVERLERECPARKVTAFRVIRVQDFSQASCERDPRVRTAQISIWNALQIDRQADSLGPVGVGVSGGGDSDGSIDPFKDEPRFRQGDRLFATNLSIYKAKQWPIIARPETGLANDSDGTISDKFDHRDIEVYLCTNRQTKWLRLPLPAV